MKILKYLLSLFLIKFSMAGTFSELRGIEDSSGNTHLFYRIYQVIPGIYGDGCSNSIYHFDLSNSIDTLFLNDWVEPDYFPPPYHGGGNLVLDYEFWNNDPSQFIYCGFSWGTDLGWGYICRYNSEFCFRNYGPPMSGVEISKQNDSLLFASNEQILFKSTDGGHVWEEFNFLGLHFQLINISPFNDSILFSIHYSHIYKSNNGGLTFTLVDSNIFYGNNFHFDSDSIHIYGVSNYDFIRSTDFGNSWQIISSDTTSLNISVDQFISGQIYLSKHNQILFSNDFGNTFQLFAELDNEIIGLYKKPMLNKIYAATPLDIYEIDSTEIHLIKHLTAIDYDDSFTVSPSDYELEQNYPNPFNSTTIINCKINEPGHIRIVLYDLSGKEIEVMVDQHQMPGYYHYQWDARDLASGIYFYTLIIDENPVATKKTVLIK
ncbi:MAG TPA: T9SS type A sorting domain-containing protein [bacterium]